MAASIVPAAYVGTPKGLDGLPVSRSEEASRARKNCGEIRVSIVHSGTADGSFRLGERHACAFDPTGLAFDTIDTWIANIRAHPGKKVAGNKPAAAVDSCFAGDGSLIYPGRDAWDGILDRRPPGPCTSAFPLYTTSRIEAGGGIRGDVFKCALRSVDGALADGVYGGVAFSPAETGRLREIFPAGVCDYRQPDEGRPWWLSLGRGR